MGTRHTFDDKASLAAALADALIVDLNAGISSRGRAVLAVSGGSTPAMLFAKLSERADVDWSKVTITLVDERWVNDLSDRSNAKLVKQNLLINHAATAQFAPLYGGGDAPTTQSIADVNASLGDLGLPFDAVILGMGNDGHTASFFPGGDTLAEALTNAGPVLALSADGADEPRVTWTLPNLLNTKKLYLHIEGQAKADTLDKALQDGEIADMPIRAVLRQSDVAVQIYWCG